MIDPDILANEIARFRVAAINLRRQRGTTAFQLAANSRCRNAHASNRQITEDIAHHLVIEGHQDLVAALWRVHELSAAITQARHRGRTSQLDALREEIREPRRLIREALRR